MGRIVVGLDRSDASRAALRWAADEARRDGAELTVVHAFLAPIAYAGTAADIAEHDPELYAQAMARFDGCIAESGADLRGLDPTTRLHSGRAADGLLAEAATAELLVVGSRGAGGIEGTLLGATAEHCARHAPCPLVVVPPQEPRTSGRVVVGVDGSAVADRALAWAIGVAARRGARVEVVGVAQPYDRRGPFGGDFMQLAAPGSSELFRREARRHVDRAIASLAPEAADRIEATVLSGHPAAALVSHAAAADLLVVGRRGHQVLRPFHLGSVARHVLHTAEVPVAVVPG